MIDQGPDESVGGKRRTNLGRGLDALFGEDDASFEVQGRERASRTMPVELIRPNPKQPRRRFSDEELGELVASVREQGVLQPILVRPSPTLPDLYEIVAGERRWRAAQRAQLHDVPVVVRELDDSSALQIAIIENIQRESLTPVEEADGYRRLQEDFGHTQEQIGQVVGKSRSHIANTLRLLDLPSPVRRLVDDGTLSAGHGRALLACPDPEAAARTVVSRGLNVRQTEKLARDGAAKTGRPRKSAASGPGKDANLQALEQEMSNRLGLRVSVDPAQDGGSGMVTIRYQSLDQFDDLLRRLGLSHGQPPHH